MSDGSPGGVTGMREPRAACEDCAPLAASCEDCAPYSALNLKLKGYVDRLANAVKTKNWRLANTLLDKGGMSMNIPDILDAIEQVEKEMGSRAWKAKRTKMKKKI